MVTLIDKLEELHSEWQDTVDIEDGEGLGFIDQEINGLFHELKDRINHY